MFIEKRITQYNLLMEDLLQNIRKVSWRENLEATHILLSPLTIQMKILFT